MLRGVLLFIAGALVGANLVYFVMSRHPGAGSVAPDVTLHEISREPVPGEPPVVDGRPDVPGTLDPARPRSKTTAPEGVLPDADADQAGAAKAGSAAENAAVRRLTLIVPVRGITADALANTYEDARGAGRVHEALDIMAPTGTPVLAVADGEVEKLFTSDLGGLTIYQFEPTGRYAYYYAHLDRYAADLKEGQTVKQGEVIGYVGSTGNASDDGPHLHFGLFELGPEREWWKGTAINPYPVFMAAATR